MYGAATEQWGTKSSESPTNPPSASLTASPSNKQISSSPVTAYPSDFQHNLRPKTSLYPTTRPTSSPTFDILLWKEGNPNPNSVEEWKVYFGHDLRQDVTQCRDP
ncbi:hypothetical protein ACHAWO_010635 [Cyclotella atomus]|uniref:Uncharacterized protein n=1 Tax=Cyclotella atomus TaxID=382360 RepID=A0ABD3PS05_9STRA